MLRVPVPSLVLTPSVHVDENESQSNSPAHNPRECHRGRRTSFLYSSGADHNDGQFNIRHSEQEILTAARQNLARLKKTSDDLIVTPYAQILASLRNVGRNFCRLHDLEPCNQQLKSPEQEGSDPEPLDHKQVAEDTLAEFEWCLAQLDKIQVCRSVADLTTSKFKRLLTNELTRLSSAVSGGGSGESIMKGVDVSQIAHFISSNFLDTSDFELPRDDSRSFSTDIEGLGSLDYLSGGSSSRPSRAASISSVAGAERTGSIMSLVNHPDLKAYLDENLDHWGLDVFKICEWCSDLPLVPTMFRIFEEHNLFKVFRISESQFLRFTHAVANSYHNSNPYHNNLHAADVCQSVHVMLSAAPLSDLFSDMEIMAIIFSAACHDIGHPGVTNQFLVNTHDELSLLYNDQSVLENYHISKTWRILTCEDNGAYNFLQNISERQRQSFRRITIDLVLATDMAKHMSLLADLKTMVETHRVCSGGLINMDSYAERIQLLQNMLHCADLSNPCKPLPLYRQWVDRVMKEYWLQGDRELELGLPISAMCDRTSVNVAQTQVGFIDFIVLPLWETWAELVCPVADDILSTLQENRDYYEFVAQDNSSEEHCNDNQEE